MKKALFIAYQFPPHGGGGVQRTTKFLKYLPSFGWQGAVLTGDEPARVEDTSLYEDIPEDTLIERTRGMLLPRRPSRVRQFLAKWVLTVDSEVGWLPAAVRRGGQMLKNGDYSIIYSTSAPYTDHLVGLRLKHEFQLPWVADFRDPWTQNLHDLFPTEFHRRICMNLERKIVSEADRVLVVSEPMRQQFLRSYPEIDPHHFVTITNGFDEDDIEAARPKDKHSDKFHLVYTGSLYGKRSIRTVFSAMRLLRDSELISAANFQLSIIGSYGLEAPQLVKEWALSDLVKLVKYVPHKQLTSYQQNADVLLLIIGKSPRSEIILTGKIFEYLATEKPILASVPEGAAATLLREANVGVIVDPDDASAVADTLKKLFIEWQTGKLQIEPNRNAIQQYSRRNVTQKLIKVFEELA